MAGFADFQAIDNTEAEPDANVSDIEFIDDGNNFNENVETYYVFTNVNRRLENAVQDSFIDFDYSQEVNNYCSGDYGPSDDVKIQQKGLMILGVPFLFITV